MSLSTLLLIRSVKLSSSPLIHSEIKLSFFVFSKNHKKNQRGWDSSPKMNTILVQRVLLELEASVYVIFIKINLCHF